MKDIRDANAADNPDLEYETERDDAVITVALQWSLAMIIVVLLVGGAVAWYTLQRSPQVVTTPVEAAPPKVRELPQVEVPELPFQDITAEAGITFVHENGATGEKLLPETMGGGCAFFDYDGDGDPDILFVNSQRWPQDTTSDAKPATMELYRNDGTGHFENVTREAGLDQSFYGMGVAAGDYDNDGRVDLFFTAVGRNRLFHNEGDRFEEVTDVAGVAGQEDAWSTSTGWFDYDNDGDLDLFVCNYVVWNREFDIAQNFQLKGGGRAYGRPQNFSGTYPYLYRNDGEGRFTDVSAEAGIQVDNFSTGTPMAKSLGLAFADFDNDGYIDVVVSNDTVQNMYFHNLGNGSFEELATVSGIAYDPQGLARGAMGIDVARFRNNGEIGVAIGNFSNEMTALYVTPSEMVQFTDEAVSNGLGPSTLLQLTFGLFFFDCDLDGRLDLFAANGHLEEDINLVQQSQHYEQSPQLFWNCGPEFPTEFLPVPESKTGAEFHEPLVGRGAAYADIDGDGDLDVLIATTGQKPRLLRNDQELAHHWLRVKLVGTRSNTDAIGAWVEVQVQDRTLRQQVMPTRSYLSQSELPVTFGLGSAEQIEKLTVIWPGGEKKSVAVEGIDRLIEVRQGK